ncbi:uncharacterized protein LOC143301550 [Babylonia areolata]|uniref:uncharacterized protein LOC143301550 n=1 Tax=Babylonia areolata TaxID=304850 RepID=UPI003FD2EBA5
MGKWEILFKVEKQPSSTGEVYVVVTKFIRHHRTGVCTISPSNAVTSSSNSVVRPSVLSQPPADTQCSIPSSSAAVSTSPVSSPPTSTASGTTLKGSSHSQDLSTSATPYLTSSSSLSAASGLDDGAEDKPSSTVIALAVALAVAVAALLVAVVVIMWLRRKIHTGTKRAETRTMGTDAIAPTPGTADPAEDTAGEPAPDEAIAPSLYDVTGELSPPNHYSSLQGTGHYDVIDTSATPQCDVSKTDAASYYNVGGNTQSSYYNVGGPIMSPDDANDDEKNVYEEQM